MSPEEGEAATDAGRLAKMMDKRIEIWNLLHDGEITAIEQIGETLTVFVSIPYLRRKLRPLGDSFVLIISGLTRLEYSNYDGKPYSLAEEIEVAMTEILSTDSKAMPIKVHLTMGHLILDYQAISFTLDTGQTIAFEEIERTCEEYWTEWKAKADQGG